MLFVVDNGNIIMVVCKGKRRVGGGGGGAGGHRTLGVFGCLDFGHCADLREKI